MQKFVLVSIFVVGFLLFVIIMEILSVDHILIKILNMDEKEKSYNNEVKKTTFLQKGTEESRTILHPEDSKKPLKLSKEEIGRHSW